MVEGVQSIMVRKSYPKELEITIFLSQAAEQ